MKLAKKMLASVIALALVAAFALTAFAAAPAVSLTATKAVVGEEVTITVSGKDMAGLESAVLEFTYDAEALEFVSIDKTADAAYDMGTGDKLADSSTITWAIIYMNAAKADSGLAVLTFKVLKAGDTDVALRIDSWDGTAQPADATVTVKAEEKTTTPAPTTPAPTTPAEPTSKEDPTTGNQIPQTGEAGVAAIAGVMALAAVAFVATRKKDEE